MRNASCREIRDQLIEAARAGTLTPTLAAHVEKCEGCARFHARQSRLSSAFALLSEGLGPAPPRIEAALLAELDRRDRERRKVPVRRRGYRIAVFGGAIAATLVAGLVLRSLVLRDWAFQPHTEPIVAMPSPVPAFVAPEPVAAEPPPVSIQPKRRAPVPEVKAADPVADINSSPFVELPWTVPLAPNEPASVVRMNLAVSALIAAGFSVDADPASAAAADVVVGVDGRARAVRLISISDTVNSNRRKQ
jgi:hypothetical protein